jgi:UDP-N-acetylmuramoyl-tripeptide--D-alanyl-D-alanine ligase
MFNHALIADIIRPKKIIGAPAHEAVFTRISTDTRSIERGDVFVALKGKSFDGNLFLRAAQAKGAALIVASSLPDDEPFGVPVMLVKDTAYAYARLAGYVRRRQQAFVLGITGSYGKTTAKEMAAHLFSSFGKTHRSAANENNAIGVPKTLLGIESDTKYAVIEMGTNVKGEIAFEAESAFPDCAIVTGIADVHTETFKDKRGVRTEKLSIFKKAPFAVAVLNHDDPMLRGQKVGRKQVWFGTDASCDVRFEIISKGHCHVTLKINGEYELILNTYASFYAYNATAVIAAATVAGIPLKDAVAAMRRFVFPKMRTELTEAKGMKLFNDAYNSNPFALEQSLAEFRAVEALRKIAVIGDMLELGPLEKAKHKDVVRAAQSYPADKIVLVGPRLCAAAASLKSMGKIVCAKDADDAATVLAGYVRSGDAILFKGSRGIALEKIITRLTA